MKEFQQFRAAYCGLCHTMGRRCGLWSRFGLNYDFAFLAMLLEGDRDAPPDCMSRCIASPFRKRRTCQRTPAFDAAADHSVILTYWKLRDTVRDEGFWKGNFARFLSVCLKGAYRKAQAKRPAFDQQVRTCLEQLRALEEAKCPSMDQTADTFARLLMAAGEGAAGDGQRRAVEQLLYHLGRWIYLADAYDDLWEDMEKGRYNPLVARFGLKEPCLPAEDRALLQTTMRHSLNLAAAAYGLGQFGRWSPILENILYLSLPMATDRILTEETVKWSEFSKSVKGIERFEAL